MAGRGAPSFLKRQKEQQRVARAQAKREAKQARRENRAAEARTEEVLDDMVPSESAETTAGTDDTPAL